MQEKPAMMPPASGPTITPEAARAAFRHARQVTGLSQQDLSLLARLSRNYVGELEAGRLNPSPRGQAALASALEVPADILFGGAANEAAMVARRVQVARLYSEQTMAELAARFGCNPTTIWKDVKALGLTPRRAGARRKYPSPPTDRTCETCGKPITFARPSDAIDTERQRKGVYCSFECKVEASRVHPTPEPRKCARPWCENIFQPRGVDVARGGGLYCSHACQRGERGGAMVACPGCGTEQWRPLWQIERGWRFCSHRCWGLYRWREGVELLGLLATLSGRARQRWLGRWAGRRAGRLGGRQRGYTDLQAKGVRELKQRDPKLGIRRLSKQTGLSEKQVRMILEAASKG